MKKYKLKIPNIIKKEDAKIATHLQDGAKGIEIYSTKPNFNEIPKDWLEEIIEEPVSAEELINSVNPNVRKHRLSDVCQMSLNQLHTLVNKAEANNELRHRPQHTYDDAHEMFIRCSSPLLDSISFEMGWKARGKAHNWEEE